MRGRSARAVPHDMEQEMPNELKEYMAELFPSRREAPTIKLADIVEGLGK